MSVRSSWKSLIKSHSFVSNQLTRTNSDEKDCQQQQLLLLGCWVADDYSEWQYSLLADGEEFKEYGKLLNLSFEPYFEMVPRLSEIVGSCNGLVCLKELNGDSYHLWNPTIQKLFTIPKSNLLDKYRAFRDKNDRAHDFDFHTLEGFGFDSSTNDYKLLRIVHVTAIDRYDDEIEWDDWIDIFSYNTGSWRDITPVDGVDFSEIIMDDDLQSQIPFANGFLYCLGFNERHRLMIWQFDIANEVFQEIILPQELAESTLSKSLRAYGDSSIALAEYSVSDDQEVTRLHLWLMQENDREA